MKIMRKNILSIFTTLILFTSTSSFIPVFAASPKLSEQNGLLDISKYSESSLEKTVTIKQLFYIYFSVIGEDIPESYKYIKLNFTNVVPNY